jgi:drug/metabolite transporter (DMT)-like permease
MKNINTCGADFINFQPILMTAGILAALGAGMIWGFVFIAPVIAHQHSPWTLALARYTVFGIVSLIIYRLFVPANKRAQYQADRGIWWNAFWLALIGNLIYYVLLSLGIQAIGVPLVTLVIGTLPVVVSVCANWRDGSVRWRVLAIPIALILFGFFLAHKGETGVRVLTTAQLTIGFLGAIGALIAWTIYPIFNDRFIKSRADVDMMGWACIQGIALLPLVAALLLLTHFFAPPVHSIFAGDVWRLVFAAVIAGILSSWLGTWLWNIASQRLPAALAGQMIVFETVFSLLYGFTLDRRWPQPIVWLGMGCLLLGVLAGVRAFHKEKSRTRAA